jgi:hypothetical protein
MSNSVITSAELFLLSKFRKFREPKEFETEFWHSVFKKPAGSLIENLYNNGYLIKADLKAILEYKCKINDLKKMLQFSDLKQTGKKEELIDRLLKNTKQELFQDDIKIILYKCSTIGETQVQKYIDEENRKRTENEFFVINALKERKFIKAIDEMVKFEASQLIPRGMGIDWNDYKFEKDNLNILAIIFKCKPKILMDLYDKELEILRIGAGMMYLYGISVADKWFPADFKSKSRFDNNTAVRMILFHAQFLKEKEELISLSKSGSIKLRHITIISSNDTCEHCKQMKDMQFELKNLPELPLEKCTHESGCRCSISPVID